MDKRIRKTKQALYAAFFQLRAKKEIRAIKIAELCQTADINKTTFYAHYKDIYELADDVERQLLFEITDSIPKDVAYTFENPEVYTRAVTEAFAQRTRELEILFSGSEFPKLGLYLEQVIKQAVFAKRPHLKDDAELQVLLSYCIHGAFHAQMSNRNLPLETVMAVTERILVAMRPLMRTYERQP
ncbi:MAG: TetR/AcrR family transcriptional regulator [Oscillibacter sp.]|nr:TetR/AcrR family transcriptional regulator [Oscillibacter sp.]